MRKQICFFILVCWIATMLPACGYIDQVFLKKPEDTAQELFQAGSDSMQEKDYASAIDYFTKLQERYPFSPMTPVGMLSLGDAYFLNRQYAEASDAYKEFESLNPRHESMAYVLFQIGMAEFKQFKTIDLPQEHTEEAVTYFRRTMEAYPGSEYAGKAEEMIAQCRAVQAKHELYVADFYWKDGRYNAAAQRYQYVMDNFQDVPDLYAYAEQRRYIAQMKAEKKKTQEDLDILNNKTKWNWL